jgi:hypothetical protein
MCHWKFNKLLVPLPIEGFLRVPITQLGALWFVRSECDKRLISMKCKFHVIYTPIMPMGMDLVYITPLLENTLVI